MVRGFFKKSHSVSEANHSRYEMHVWHAPPFGNVNWIAVNGDAFPIETILTEKRRVAELLGVSASDIHIETVR
jgi:hypothetical protein